MLNDLVDAQSQLAKGHTALHRIAASIRRAMAEPGKVEDRLAQRLAWNRAQVRAHAADDFLLLDNDNALAELHALNCRALPRRPRADNKQSNLLHSAYPFPSVAPLHKCIRARNRNRSNGQNDSNALYLTPAAFPNGFHQVIHGLIRKTRVHRQRHLLLEDCLRIRELSALGPAPPKRC